MIPAHTASQTFSQPWLHGKLETILEYRDLVPPPHQKMTQLVSTPAIKPDYLSQIPGTHTVEGAQTLKTVL